MALHHVDTTDGPIAVDGHTINVVARTTTLTLGRVQPVTVGSWSRPLYVEVLDGDGRRQVVRLRDHQRIAAAIAGLAAASIVVAGLTPLGDRPRGVRPRGVRRRGVRRRGVRQAG